MINNRSGKAGILHICNLLFCTSLCVSVSLCSRNKFLIFLAKKKRYFCLSKKETLIQRSLYGKERIDKATYCGLPAGTSRGSNSA